MSLATLEIIDESTAADGDPLPARWSRRQYYDPDFRVWVIEQLNGLRALEVGWDGYRAKPIDSQIVDAAIALVGNLEDHIGPRPRIVPTLSGGLQFEWNTGGRSLELEFEGPDKIHYLRWQPAANIEDEDFLSPRANSRVEELIKWFARADH